MKNCRRLLFGMVFFSGLALADAIPITVHGIDSTFCTALAGGTPTTSCNLSIGDFQFNYNGTQNEFDVLDLTAFGFFPDFPVIDSVDFLSPLLALTPNSVAFTFPLTGTSVTTVNPGTSSGFATSVYIQQAVFTAQLSQLSFLVADDNSGTTSTFTADSLNIQAILTESVAGGGLLGNGAPSSELPEPATLWLTVISAAFFLLRLLCRRAVSGPAKL